MSLAGILTMGIHFIDFIFVESKKKLVKTKIYMAVRLMTKKVREEKMAFKETPRIPFFFYQNIKLVAPINTRSQQIKNQN